MEELKSEKSASEILEKLFNNSCPIEKLDLSGLAQALEDEWNNWVEVEHGKLDSPQITYEYEKH